MTSRGSQQHRARSRAHASGPTRGTPPGWIALLVAAVVFAAFWPALGSTFNYDDEANILLNPHFRGLSGEHLRWMFTTFHSGHYQPLSWITLAMDHAVWGLDPKGYHLTNLLFHSANSALVLFLSLALYRLARGGREDSTGAVFGAAVAALFFGLHPLRVESVAWVTERRDVQSSFFLLAATLAYVRARAPGRSPASGDPARRRLYLTSLALYALSLGSRAIGVTLPLMLLVLDAYPLRRFAGDAAERRRAWLDKLPYVVLAIPIAVIAPLAQAETGASVSLQALGLGARVAQAFYGLVFYLWKTILPSGLSPIYDIVLPLDLSSVKYVGSAVVVLVSAGGLLVLGRRARALRAAAACHVLLLLPVLGLFQSGQQEVADRYSYLPAIAWAILLGAALAALRARWGSTGARARLLTTSVMAVLLVLSALTWRQTLVWRTPMSLWTHAVAARPCATAHHNLAGVLALDGRIDEAMSHLTEALRRNPRHWEALVNLGNLHAGEGRLDEAMSTYRQAIGIRDDIASPHLQLANALAASGRLAEAITHYHHAVELDPEDVTIRFNLGNAYIQHERWNEAITVLRGATRLAPGNVQVHWNLAGALGRAGRQAEAVIELREVLRLNPGHAQARAMMAALTNAARQAASETGTGR